LTSSQQIQYAKSKSDTIAKLDGTFKQPSALNPSITTTELQKSIFSGPPASITTSPAAANLPPRPNLAPPADEMMKDASASPAPGSLAGTKRPREEEAEEEDEGSDAAMEEDSDDD
jgi:U2 small nuclear ribonucleoprotein B''